MRILHLIYDDVGNPWLGGGGAVRTREINSRLAAMGHEVTVACGVYPGAPRQEVMDGMRYLRVAKPLWLARRGYLGSRIAYVLGAIGLLKRYPYDIVVEDVSPYSPVFSPLWSRKGSRAVASVQNLSGRHAVGKFGMSLRGLLPPLFERPLLRRFNYAVAVSPGIARQMAGWWSRGRDRGHDLQLAVIPNSSGAPRVLAESEEPYILFLGRLDPYQKGLDRLIAAYALAAPRLPEIGLVLAGGSEPADEQALVAQIKKAGLKLVQGRVETGTGIVSMTGRLSPLDGATLLAHSMFMALPSRYEAWPIVALEAAAAGKAVVGSDIVGVRDAAPGEAHGLLVPEGNVGLLAEAMVKLANDADLRRKLGRRGRGWAARYNWDALAARQEEFYRSVLESRRGMPDGEAALAR